MPACSRDCCCKLPVAGLLQQPDPTRWRRRRPRSWPVAAFSNLRGGGNSEATPGNLWPGNGRDRSGPGAGQSLLRAACSRSRPSCGFAAVAQPTTRRPAGWRALLKAACGNWRPPVCLPAPGSGDPQPGLGGTGAGRGGLPQPPASGQHGHHPAPAHAEGSWQAIQAAGQLPRLLIRRAASASHPRADGALFALQGAQPRAPPLLADGPCWANSITCLQRLAPGGGCVADELAGSLAANSSRAAPPTPCARWLALRAAAPARGLAAGRDTLSGQKASALPTIRRGFPPAADAPRPLLNGHPCWWRRLLPDEPQALLHLEALVSKLLVRTAERFSAQVLACCGTGRNCRRYLLCEELLATRSLERLRNQLNARQRWSEWFERPIPALRSRRAHLPPGRGIDSKPLLLTEPRDQNSQLAGCSQAVTLARRKAAMPSPPPAPACLRAFWRSACGGAHPGGGPGDRPGGPRITAGHGRGISKP